MTCTCGRTATHVRWGNTHRGEKDRIVCCAFHSVHPHEPHPFDLHATADWPKAVDA